MPKFYSSDQITYDINVDINISCQQICITWIRLNLKIDQIQAIDQSSGDLSVYKKYSLYKDQSKNVYTLDKHTCWRPKTHPSSFSSHTQGYLVCHLAQKSINQLQNKLLSSVGPKKQLALSQMIIEMLSWLILSLSHLKV